MHCPLEHLDRFNEVQSDCVENQHANTMTQAYIFIDTCTQEQVCEHIKWIQTIHDGSTEYSWCIAILHVNKSME